MDGSELGSIIRKIGDLYPRKLRFDTEESMIKFSNDIEAALNDCGHRFGPIKQDPVWVSVPEINPEINRDDYIFFLNGVEVSYKYRDDPEYNYLYVLLKWDYEKK